MDILFPNGDQGWISGTYGTVQGLRKWTETHVSSSGGGGYLYDGSGYISAPKVSSKIVERVEFWLKPIAPGGNELKLTINVDVRDGHRMVLIWGGLRHETKGKFLFLLNESSGQEYNLAAGSTFEKGFVRSTTDRNRQDVKANLGAWRRSLSICMVLIMFSVVFSPRLLIWALIALAVVTFMAVNFNIDERRARMAAAKAELGTNFLAFSHSLIKATSPRWPD